MDTLAWLGQYKKQRTACDSHIDHAGELQHWHPGDGPGRETNARGKGQVQVDPTSKSWKAVVTTDDPYLYARSPIPRNVKLCDWVLYCIVHLRSPEERASRWIHDFTVSGDVRVSRVPIGHPVIVLAHGVYWFPVYNGIYVLLGEEAAKKTAWILNTHCNNLKYRSGFQIGLVRAPGQSPVPLFNRTLAYHNRFQPRDNANGYDRMLADARTYDVWLGDLNKPFLDAAAGACMYLRDTPHTVKCDERIADSDTLKRPASQEEQRTLEPKKTDDIGPLAPSNKNDTDSAPPSSKKPKQTNDAGAFVRSNYGPTDSATLQPGATARHAVIPRQNVHASTFRQFEPAPARVDPFDNPATPARTHGSQSTTGWTQRSPAQQPQQQANVNASLRRPRTSANDSFWIAEANRIRARLDATERRHKEIVADFSASLRRLRTSINDSALTAGANKINARLDFIERLHNEVLAKQNKLATTFQYIYDRHCSNFREIDCRVQQLANAVDNLNRTQLPSDISGQLQHLQSQQATLESDVGDRLTALENRLAATRDDRLSK